MTIYHLSSNIATLLRIHTEKKLDYIFDTKNGEAKKELLRLQSLGHKLLPSANCKHFDPFEKGCQCRYFDSEGNRIDINDKN